MVISVCHTRDVGHLLIWGLLTCMRSGCVWEDVEPRHLSRYQSVKFVSHRDRLSRVLIL